MKKLLPIMASLLLIAFLLESCHKPPMSTGHKNFKQSRKNR